MSVIEKIHGSYVHNRRVRVLANALAALLPNNASVLDVGAGDGVLASLIQQSRPDLKIQGIDILVRQNTAIPILPFDGTTIPHPDNSFDAITFVDVLHHTNDPMILLKEAARVTRQNILIKDHTRDGLLAGPTLRFMDHVGNSRHGVALPYNYWPKQKWLAAFAHLNLKIDSWNKNLAIYPFPASLLFGRSLHFIAKLTK